MTDLPRKRYRTGGGVVIDDREPTRILVLLLDRPLRDEVRLPKGHIDPGEEARETALREVMEETGYTELEIIADLGERTVEFDYDGHHYIRREHYYLMVLRSEKQRPRPPKDAAQFQIRWVPLERATDQLTYAAEQTVMASALQAYRAR